MAAVEGQKPGITETREYDIAGLNEDKVFSDFVKAFVQDVPECAKRNFVYAFMEMMNNAIEHSDGSQVAVTVSKDEFRVAFAIKDDGVGIFTKVTDALGLDDKRHAILELAKGKFTTEPSSHTGEGIFFSSKCGDGFILEADGIVFVADADSEILSENGGRADGEKTTATCGTKVVFEINLSHKQTLQELFQEFTQAPEHYGFSKTLIPIRLLEYGDASPLLMSRSQARRLLARVERFEKVGLDFSGVDEIGQAFADEIFRVFASRNPKVELIAANCTEAVQAMINRAIGL
jgi:anti-sigma regulatory factor (Ser/Thr protein kinase)